MKYFQFQYISLVTSQQLCDAMKTIAHTEWDASAQVYVLTGRIEQKILHLK